MDFKIKAAQIAEIAEIESQLAWWEILIIIFAISLVILLVYCIFIRNNRLVLKYKVGKVLGEGTFGIVREITRRKDGVKFVLKTSSQCSPEFNEMLLKEAKIFEKYEHQNLLKYGESWIHLKQVYLVLEMCDDGDLWKYIQLHMKN